MTKVALAFILAGCGTLSVLVAQERGVPPAAELQRMAARFAPTDISADLSALSATDRRVLAKLVEASQIIDALFLRQVWSGNEAMLLDLARRQSPEDRARLHYFQINKGPWSRLDHNQPFVAGAPSKPAGGSFYPEGTSRAELERWFASLSEGERGQANGFFSVIRRRGASFAAVPYNVEYQNEVTRIAMLLREAATLATEPTLKRYLTTRAEAFL